MSSQYLMQSEAHIVNQTVELPLTRETIHRTLPARFRDIVDRYPDRVALTGNDHQWTYSRLNRCANQIAHAIIEKTGRGVGCVAFLAEQSPHMVILTLAVLKAGKAYLGIHPDMPTEAQRDIVQNAAPELLLATDNLIHQAKAMADGTCGTLSLKETSGYAEDDPAISVTPSDPSTIFYTSGSTGKSKGVVKSHESVMHRIWLSTRYDCITPQDRQSLLTHCAFSASEADIFGVLLQGGTLCVLDVMHTGMDAFRRWIDEQKITLLHPPVMLFRSLLATLEGSHLFPSVRLVALAGDVVLPSDLVHWRRFFSPECVLLHRFSTTETALLTVARFDRNSDLRVDQVNAGRPVPDKHLVLVDDQGSPVAEGATGELMVRSRYISQGYWRQPVETKAVFKDSRSDPHERIYRTGDFGRFLPDGSFVFTKRRAHLAKIRGFRVDIREIENQLRTHDAVSDTGVVVVKKDDHDEMYAFVVVAPTKAFDRHEIRGYLSNFIPEWKIPVRIEPIETLPLTLTGKIDRQSLESMASAAEENIRERTAAAGFSRGLEKELGDIWEKALKLSHVGLEDNFFELGGDSLSVLLVLDGIEQAFGTSVPMSTFLANPTIKQLAGLLTPPQSDTQVVSEEIETSDCQVAEALLDCLSRRSVDRIFVTPGSGMASVLEAVVKARALDRPVPQLVPCTHETVAMAAAHGYYMVTGRPQVVMVHADVGTQNIGANLHNAQRGRAGVVIIADRAPYTSDGRTAGGRARPTHWTSDQHHQAGTVQGYVKWHYELTMAANLPLAIDRAFEMSGTEPPGPVYLSLPPEVLHQKIDRHLLETKGPPRVSRQTASIDSLQSAARWLMAAQRPLILTAYAGRRQTGVAALVRLAEALAAPVVETPHRINFPSAHPLHLGHNPARFLVRSDCVLIVDHDVPWLPTSVKPPADCRVIHIDTDPHKSGMSLWGFQSDLILSGDSSIICADLADLIERTRTPSDEAAFEARRVELSDRHEALYSQVRQRARKASTNQPIAPEWAAYCLGQILDESMLLVSEAVSNSPELWPYLDSLRPGSYFQSMGNGLGWGLGAALGAKLAAPDKTVICVCGDGAWLFASPLAAYFASEQQGSPFLTVVLNNQIYASTAEAIAVQGGHARKSNEYPSCDLPEPPLFSRVADALHSWSRTVRNPADLPAVLQDAVAQVRGGSPALVEICVACRLVNDHTPTGR